MLFLYRHDISGYLWLSVFCYGQYHYRRSGQRVKEEEETQSPHDKQVNVVNAIFLDYYIFAHFYRPRGTGERKREREREREREGEADACLYCHPASRFPPPPPPWGDNAFLPILFSLLSSITSPILHVVTAMLSSSQRREGHWCSAA